MTIVEHAEQNENPATRELAVHEVDFRLFQHDGPVRSLARAAGHGAW